MLLESLQCNSNLHVLNLSSCCLTNRSATCLSVFFKKRKADLLQNVWTESTLSRDAHTTKVYIEKKIILIKIFFTFLILIIITHLHSHFRKKDCKY